jgi:hypothetical protein
VTGGFAFYVWFGSNPHAGDFVLTVGGYHPAFAPPAWYPVPARVGFNWNVGSSVAIKGDAYFALTPSAVMAGGNLEALFHHGSLRAWFIAYADFLIQWKPFHFEGHIGISIGVSVRVDLLFTTVTLQFELGASLDLWGPPTGGVVHVHLYVVSFSVAFGSSRAGAAPPMLDWPGFASLLPQQTGEGAHREAARAGPLVLTARVNRGLTREDNAGAWYVRADELMVTVSSAVPATAITFDTGTPARAAGAAAVTPPSTIDIRPMGLSKVTSSLHVTLVNQTERIAVDLTAWTQLTETSNVPEALWGAPVPKGSTPQARARTIPNLPTGVRLIAPPASAGQTPGAMDLSSLIDPLGGGYDPLTPVTQTDPIPAPVADDGDIVATIMRTLASADAQAAQQGLVAALTAVGAAPPTSALLTRLAERAGEAYAQPPLRAEQRLAA